MRFNPWYPAIQIEIVFIIALVCLAMGDPSPNQYALDNAWVLAIPFVLVAVYCALELTANAINLFRSAQIDIKTPENGLKPLENEQKSPLHRIIPYSVGGKLRKTFTMDVKHDGKLS
jgi:hypothetical protein